MQLKHKLAFMVLVGLLVFAWQVVPLLTANSATAQKAKVSAYLPDAVKRGEYLVEIMGCHDCHTPWVQGRKGPPVPDRTRPLIGHPEGLPHPTWTPADFKDRHIAAMFGPMLTATTGPWGVSFATNLTPDKETGMLEWNEQAFIQALRTGKHQGQPNGRAILPPMPWEAYKHATDQDLKAIWAYLRSIPAIKNKVPEPIPPASPPMAEKR
jgi:hypothetical protein